MKFIPLPFYQLNRLRGTYSIFAKVNAVIIGLIFGYVTKNPYVGSAMAIGYLAGESRGWGEWIGGILRQGAAYIITKRNGDTNGIQWLATRFTELDSQNYFRVALFIRGIYWWLPALIPLAFVINPFVVVSSILVLALGFPASVLLANHFKPEFNTTERWSLAENYYGGLQDVILIGLIGVYYVTN